MLHTSSAHDIDEARTPYYFATADTSGWMVVGGSLTKDISAIW